MRLAVNPNRMELLRLRRRLALARRGHKLLKDKLEEIMRQFLENMNRLIELQGAVTRRLRKVTLSFALVSMRSPRRELEAILPQGRLLLKTMKERVLNVSIPRFEIQIFEPAEYDLLQSESELDVGVMQMRLLLDDLLLTARLWKAVELLSREIEATRRRVNALEHILIPNIQETIKYISGRLEEIERSYQVQLLRVKEIVRHH